MNPEQRTVNIEIGDKEWEGVYSNFVIITHSTSEFVIDFARITPGVQKARVLSRIIMTPQHARMMERALADNLKKFESQFGEIKLHGEQNKGQIGFTAERSASAEVDAADSKR